MHRTMNSQNKYFVQNIVWNLCESSYFSYKGTGNFANRMNFLGLSAQSMGH